MVRRVASFCTLAIALAISGCPSDPSLPDAPIGGDGGPDDGGGSDAGPRDGGRADAPSGPTCGDGNVEGVETCDDDNTTAGDGCDASCAVEDGWDCDDAEPTVCTEVCGDGTVVGAEAEEGGCDDGNTDADDGCDASCAVETGWGCTGEPSDCAVVCGDGLVTADEACDDGNTTAGDGCDASCVAEAGWLCDAAEPTVCAEVCGDGAVVGDEAGPNGCDDGGTAADDGCGPTCVVEMGWACMDAPSVCTPDCGDGLVNGAEGCDDGNNADEDGCSMGCQVETGWTCGSAEPTTCTSTCGDGTVALGAEVCDDGNTVSETGCPYGTASCAGCSADCGTALRLTGNVCGDDNADPANEACDDGNTVVEACPYGLTSCVVCGATCTNVPGTPSFCGDTLLDTANGEVCDDGNTATELGCAYGTAMCTGCAADCSAALMLTGNVCGDGVIDASNETCDDADATSGDGCSDRCAVEPNFRCTGSPSVCVPLCGDGALDPGETCDDSNTTAGDGCSEACQLEISCGAGETVFRFADPRTVLIPDNVVNGIVSPFSVPTAGAPTRVVFHIARITHPWASDVDVVLTGPSGLTRDVSTDNGSSGDDYVRTYLSDDAATAITAGAAPFTGRFRPEQPFTGLAPFNAAGQWTVSFSDDAADDTGSVLGWSIAMCIDPALPFCGNGVSDPSEVCDDGNTVETDACLRNCTANPCGNGVVGAGETCDDGNRVAADGCSSTCATEPGYVCSGAPSVCQLIVCGDGLRQGTEACDDGNTTAADGCSTSCTVEAGFRCTTASPSVCTRVPYLVAPLTGITCIDTSAGTSVAVLADDQVSASAALPFAFTYFGASVTNWVMSSNGNLQLISTAGSTAFSNATIPTLAPPNSLVAPFWDDLLVTSTPGPAAARVITTGTAPNRTFVADWVNYRPSGAATGAGLSFQVILEESTNAIEFRYCSITGTSAQLFGSSATIGIENATGTDGVLHSFNTAGAISAGSGFRFTPNP